MFDVRLEVSRGRQRRFSVRKRQVDQVRMVWDHISGEWMALEQQHPIDWSHLQLSCTTNYKVFTYVTTINVIVTGAFLGWLAGGWH